MHNKQLYAESSQQRAGATFACGLPFPSSVRGCGAGLFCSWGAGCLCCHNPTWAHRNSDLHKHEVQASIKISTRPTQAPMAEFASSAQLFSLNPFEHNLRTKGHWRPCRRDYTRLSDCCYLRRKEYASPHFALRKATQRRDKMVDLYSIFGVWEKVATGRHTYWLP